MPSIINSITIDNQLNKAKSLVSMLTFPGTRKLMFPNIDDAIIVQHTLVSNVLMSATQTAFHIPILANDQRNGVNTFVTENRLQLQDLFVCTEVGMFVAVPTSASDGRFPMYSYAPPTVFSTANTASSIQGAYTNGYIRQSSNNQVISPYWDTYKHYNVPQTQIASAVGYTTSTNATVGSVDGATDGFYPVTPGWVFNGGGNLDMNFIIPQNMQAVETNSRFVFMWRGFLLQNASGVK
jgi:hypothetical protein